MTQKPTDTPFLRSTTVSGLNRTLHAASHTGSTKYSASHFHTHLMTAEEACELHFRIADQVPESPDRIGIAALEGVTGTSQRGRIERAVNTLVALDVLTCAGQRRGCDFKEELVRVATWLPGRRDLELHPTLDDDAFVDQMAGIGFLRVSRGCMVA